MILHLVKRNRANESFWMVFDILSDIVRKYLFLELKYKKQFTRCTTSISSILEFKFAFTVTMGL